MIFFHKILLEIKSKIVHYIVFDFKFFRNFLNCKKISIFKKFKKITLINIFCIFQHL